MSLNAIFRYPDLYQTAVAVASISDQRLYDTIYQERYMGLPDDNPEGYRDGSPITFADRLRGQPPARSTARATTTATTRAASGWSNRLIAAEQAVLDDGLPEPHPRHQRGGEHVAPPLYELMTRYLEENLPAGPRD